MYIIPVANMPFKTSEGIYPPKYVPKIAAGIEYFSSVIPNVKSINLLFL